MYYIVLWSNERKTKEHSLDLATRKGELGETIFPIYYREIINGKAKRFKQF